jgi:hypothetical protein
MNKKRITGGLIAFAAIVVMPFTMASDCSNAAQQSGPDPLPVDIKPAKIVGAYQLPDGFRNVVEWCDGAGNSHATTSRGSDLAGGQNGGGLPSSGWLVRLEDPRCAR